MFKMLKCSGILKHNMKTAGRKDAVLLREWKSKNSGSTVVCDSCHYLPHITALEVEDSLGVIKFYNSVLHPAHHLHLRPRLNI